MSYQSIKKPIEEFDEEDIKKRKKISPMTLYLVIIVFGIVLSGLFTFWGGKARENSRRILDAINERAVETEELKEANEALKLELETYNKEIDYSQAIIDHFNTKYATMLETSDIETILRTRLMYDSDGNINHNIDDFNRNLLSSYALGIKSLRVYYKNYIKYIEYPDSFLVEPEIVDAYIIDATHYYGILKDETQMLGIIYEMDYKSGTLQFIPIEVTTYE